MQEVPFFQHMLCCVFLKESISIYSVIFFKRKLKSMKKESNKDFHPQAHGNLNEDSTEY